MASKKEMLSEVARHEGICLWTKEMSIENYLGQYPNLKHDGNEYRYKDDAFGDHNFYLKYIGEPCIDIYKSLIGLPVVYERFEGYLYGIPFEYKCDNDTMLELWVKYRVAYLDYLAVKKGYGGDAAKHMIFNLFVYSDIPLAILTAVYDMIKEEEAMKRMMELVTPTKEEHDLVKKEAIKYE
jgi:hypothetical protein